MGGALSQARGELQGIRFLQAIDTVDRSLQTHGARAFVFASGDAARRASVLSVQRQVDAAMSRLDGVSAGLGELYGVTRGCRHAGFAVERGGCGDPEPSPPPRSPTRTPR